MNRKPSDRALVAVNTFPLRTKPIPNDPQRPDRAEFGGGTRALHGRLKPSHTSYYHAKSTYDASRLLHMFSCLLPHTCDDEALVKALPLPMA